MTKTADRREIDRYFARLKTEVRTVEARRDACAGHEFVRVQSDPPKWYCPRCAAAADRRYVRAFERGLVAAGADPADFIRDYGAWP